MDYVNGDESTTLVVHHACELAQSLNSFPLVKDLNTYEEVKIHQFKNARGEIVNIAWTKEMQDSVGLPFEAFSEMQKTFEAFSKTQKRLDDELAQKRWELDLTHKQLKFAHKQVLYFCNMTFWQRLKYLITNKVAT
jgi:hypothetical protein